jgi:hypothetical protein
VTIAPINPSMNDPTPQAIASGLSPKQRDIISSGPENFSEADAIPEGLFEHDLTYDRDEGDETHVWIATDLGRQVRQLIDAEEQ